MEMLAIGFFTFFGPQKRPSKYSRILSRLKQHTIHEKCAEQKRTMMALEQEHLNNGVLYLKIVTFNTMVEQLRTQPPPDAPAPGVTMICSRIL
jgi:hypothetical protein